MTRINANIKPAHLIDQHLIAEYREIVRIPNYVCNNVVKARSGVERAPKHFKLNTGHVLFFYDKLKFLHNRFLAIKDEMNHRHIENNMNDEMFSNIPDEFYNNIGQDDLIAGNNEVTDRILLRISTMKKQPTLNKMPIIFEKYSKLLCNLYK